MSVNFSESKTKSNLMRAFSWECQAAARYEFAADKAKKMGCGFISNIFTVTADQEKAHAKVFYDHLKQQNGETVFVDNAGYTVDNFDEIGQILRGSQHNEYEEADRVYPEFARIAKEEGFPDIAFSFEKIAAIEKLHGDRFGCFAGLLESCKMFEGDEECEWMCLNCGNVHKGKFAPEQCPVCQANQGYFVPFKYYKFISAKYGIAED